MLNNAGVAPKVLFIHNEHMCTEAMLGDAFSERGFDIETFEVVPAERVETPAVDVTFPDPTAYDVIVPLGARWPVYERSLVDTWVTAEMDMMRAAADAGVGILGVCFGGQLLAQTFGGSVARAESAEVGWFELDTDDGGLIAPGPWFQWHFDRWTVPPGAREIARTSRSSQAFVLGRSLALQFHPEVDVDLLEGWLADDREGISGKLGYDHDDLRLRTKELADDAAVRVRELVRAFLDKVVRTEPAS